MLGTLESHRVDRIDAVDEPERWLVSTRLLDLEDPRLRLRAHSLTQLCKSPREKALAVYGFVKRMPFHKPLKMRLRTAREVMDAGRGDAEDKGTLLVALLRTVDIPCRLRYYEMRGEVLRGLTSGIATGGRPFLEVWLGGQWLRTDTYIFDAAYMAAARQRLKDASWEWGYGIHREGHTIWSASADAYLGGMAPDDDPMAIKDMGTFNDPFELLSSPAWKAAYPRIARAVHWNVLAPMMDKVVRELHAEARASIPLPAKRGPSPAP